MEVRQCKECGKLFQYIGRPLCHECMEEMDRKFLKVREYLYKNANANIEKIAEETGVARKYILDFIKDERLSLQSADGVLICERCGAAIQTGRHCAKCKGQLGRMLTDTLPTQVRPAPEAPTSRPGARMHIKYDK